MSQEDLETVRARMESSARPTKLTLEFFSPEFELHQASSIVDTAGVFRGPSALRETLAELEEAFEDLTFEGERFLQSPAGEVVVIVRVRGTGKGSGIKLDNQIAHVWTFREGKAHRLKIYEEPEEALDAVGIQE